MLSLSLLLYLLTACLTLRCLSDVTGAEGDADDDDGLAQLGDEEDMSDNELMTTDESEEEFETLPDESGEMGVDQVRCREFTDLNWYIFLVDRSSSCFSFHP